MANVDDGRGADLLRQVQLWALVLVGIAGLIALFVALGLPIAGAVMAAPTVVLLAVQVVRNFQGDYRPLPPASGGGVAPQPAPLSTGPGTGLETAEPAAEAGTGGTGVQA